MALRFFGRSSAPAVPTPEQKLAAVPQRDAFLPGDALPLPEVEEKNTDSIWAAWTDAVNEKDEPEPPQELLPNFLQTVALPQHAAAPTQPVGLEDEPAGDGGFPATVIMDLPEMLRGRE